MQNTLSAGRLNERERALLKRVADFCRAEVLPHCGGGASKIQRLVIARQVLNEAKTGTLNPHNH